MDYYFLVALVLGFAGLLIGGFILRFVGQKRRNKDKDRIGSIIIWGLGGFVGGSIASIGVVSLICLTSSPGIPTGLCGFQILLWGPVLAIFGAIIGVIIARKRRAVNPI